MKRWKIVAMRLRARIEDNPQEVTESTVDDYETYLRAVVSQEFKDQDQWLFALVLSAYLKGIKTANKDLRKARFSVPDTDLEAEEEAAQSVVFSDPQHRKEFLLLLRRVKADIESLKEYIIQQTITKIIDASQSEDLAKESAIAMVLLAQKPAKSTIYDAIVRTFANATLVTFLLNGIQEVFNLSEATIQTAGDHRVCDRCKSYEGKRYTISEAKGLIPFHPLCRCKWVPVRE